MTPTTEDIRQAWIYRRYRGGAQGDIAAQEFDTWLHGIQTYASECGFLEGRRQS